MLTKSYIGFKAWDMGFDAHLTLLYTDRIYDEAEQNRISWILHETIMENTKFQRPLWMKRDQIKLFGPNKNIPVITLTPFNQTLTELRELLIKREVPNRSEYPWSPHITLPVLLPVHGKIILPEIIKLTDLGYY